MTTERDLEAIESYDEPSNYVQRNTGPRHEPPARCYWCAAEIDDPRQHACSERAIHDASGRTIAPAQSEPAARPDGPWRSNRGEQ